MKITVVNNVTLDGVMQAPGDPDEDPRDGFTHGGWAVPYNDRVLGDYMAQSMRGGDGVMLFGRRTYLQLHQAWSGRTDNMFTRVLDATPKYVVSTTLTEPLPWVNSTVLAGDPADAVAALKAESNQDATILGSGMLIRALLAENLIDELVLTVHPLVLGRGRRLFPAAGAVARFDLVESLPTTTGVLITRYRLAR